jgi:hypothetical protein
MIFFLFIILHDFSALYFIELVMKYRTSDSQVYLLIPQCDLLRFYIFNYDL